MTSIIKVDTIQNKAGSTSLAANKLPNMLSGSAKSWVANVIHSSQTLGDSFNQSSYTDVGLGRVNIGLTNNMSSAVFSVVCGNAEGAYPYQGFSIDAATYRVSTVNSSGNFSDGRNNAAVFGDLA